MKRNVEFAALQMLPTFQFHLKVTFTTINRAACSPSHPKEVTDLIQARTYIYRPKAKRANHCPTEGSVTMERLSGNVDRF